MSKQVLIETQTFQISPLQLTEGAKAPSGNPLVEGILATAEIKNGNGRYYSKDLWKREIDKYKEVVKEKVPPKEYKHDATKAPVVEEEEYDFTIEIPDE